MSQIYYSSRESMPLSTRLILDRDPQSALLKLKLHEGGGDCRKLKPHQPSTKEQHTKEQHTKESHDTKEPPRTKHTQLSACSPEFTPFSISKQVKGGGSPNKVNWSCTNCGEVGHGTSQCKGPSTSYGIISFRINPITLQPEYLMICRKHSLGYMDFIRGKMPLVNRVYLMRMINQMTRTEKADLRRLALTPHLCQKDKIVTLIQGVTNINGIGSAVYRTYVAPQETVCLPESIMDTTVDTLKPKMGYNLVSLINDSDAYGIWEEPEWGFPKGKRNNYETEFACAIREFNEETGFPAHMICTVFPNTCSVSETFCGSNGKIYRHKYFMMYVEYKYSLAFDMNGFQVSEVSNMQWKNFDQCLESIRKYNIEKIEMLKNIHKEIMSNLNSQIVNKCG